MVQRAMSKMMSDQGISTVTVPSSSTNDFTSNPASIGAVALGTSLYLRVPRTEYYYCWDSKGRVTLTGETSELCPPAAVAEPTPASAAAHLPDNVRLLARWGSKGARNGQFALPLGIAVDTSGNVYVTDNENHRVQRFSANGEFLSKWGSRGSRDGQFNFPGGIAVDREGRVYVADENDRVQVFSASGEFLRKWGSKGAGDGQFDHPIGIAVDPSGNVYVTESSNDRVQVFSPGGEFVRAWRWAQEAEARANSICLMG